MNGKLNFSNDSVGTDPTTIEVIDTLEINETTEKKYKEKSPKQKKESKGKDLLKAIIFTVVLIILMIGVAYGLYYYLSLGNKRKKKPEIVLQNKTIYVGQAISSNINDYGTFDNIDVTSCTLDIKNVNVSEIGEYEYSVTCDESKYSAKIIVTEKNYFSLNTTIVYKNVGDNIYANEFVSSKESYAYTFADEKVDTTQVGGPYVVKINVKDSLNNMEEIYGIYFVTEKKASYNLTCKNGENSNGDIKYYLTDTFDFDENQSLLNVSYRAYEMNISEKKDYYDYIYNANNGKITVGNLNGYFLRNDEKRRITIINGLSQNALDLEYQGSFPTSFADIAAYYQNTKKYSCKNMKD